MTAVATGAEEARALAEAAVRKETAGEREEAVQLLREAERLDLDAVSAVLLESDSAAAETLPPDPGRGRPRQAGG